jgi:cytosine/uracil/thiamine/allantoin permease
MRASCSPQIVNLDKNARLQPVINAVVSLILLPWEKKQTLSSATTIIKVYADKPKFH